MKAVMTLLVLTSIIVMVFLVREYVISKRYKRRDGGEDTLLPRMFDEIGLIIKLETGCEFYGENSVIRIPQGRVIAIRPADLDALNNNTLESEHFGAIAAWEFTHCFKANDDTQAFNCSVRNPDNTMEQIVKHEDSPSDELDVVCRVTGPEGFIEKIAFCKIIYFDPNDRRQKW